MTRTPILPHTRHSCAQRVDGCAPPGAPVLGECVDPIGRARSPVALCPSLRVLSPPQLATRFARRHKARRRLPDASSAQTVRGRNNDSETHVPDRRFATVQKLAKKRFASQGAGKNRWARMTGLRAFPTRFPPPSAQRTSQDLDTSAQLFVGRENCPFRLASGHRGHFSIRAGRSVRSSGQKSPLFSLECPFPACASTSRPPCAPRRHPLPARSMAPPRWVFQQKSFPIPPTRALLRGRAAPRCSHRGVSRR